MFRRILSDQRGTAVLLTIGMMVFILAMVGVAVDLAYQFAAIGEIEKSMEAAALAGAGNLGFNATAFPGARQAAAQYALLNPQHNPLASLINLNQNPGNAPNGDIVLGVWQNNTFTPSLDGTLVNAIRCQFATQVPTSFLRVLGVQTLPVSASAIAVSNPPATPPPDACLFPIGVGSCPFQNASSTGCGSEITFISSSGQPGAGCLAPPCTNTAAWVNISGTSTPNANYLDQAITAAASGNCPASGLQTGDSIPTGNGMIQSVMDTLTTAFIQQYNASAIQQITDGNGNVTYSGKGWKVYIPVIQTACPAGAISGSHTIIGWTQLIMTQVINQGQCAVANHWAGNSWDAVGAAPNCYGTNPPANAGALRAIFGYYSCTIIPANPVPNPVPRSALASRLRLVKMYQ